MLLLKNLRTSQNFQKLQFFLLSKRVARGRAEAPAVFSEPFFSEASGMSRSVRENSAQLFGKLADAAVVSCERVIFVKSRQRWFRVVNDRA